MESNACGFSDVTETKSVWFPMSNGTDHEWSSCKDPFERVFGESIAEVRKEQEISQAAVGKYLGFSPSEIDQIELGMRTVKIGVARSIAEKLGVTFTELIAKAERKLCTDDNIIVCVKRKNASGLGDYGIRALVEGYLAINSLSQRDAVLDLVSALNRPVNDSG